MRLSKPLTLFVFNAIALLATIEARAGIISTTGATQIATPPDVTYGVVESAIPVIFPETQNVFVPSLGQSGDSYLLHFDPVGIPPRPPVIVSGSVTFAEQILAVFSTDEQLDMTDALLGAGGTLYPFNVNLRGLENDGVDDFMISPDGRTVAFTFRTRPAIDSIRIVTQPQPVPEPASVALWMTLLLIVTAGCLYMRQCKSHPAAAC